MNNIALITAQNNAHTLFDMLDVTESTRKDYKHRIGLFLGFVKEQSFHQNIFLEYKRYLESRTDLSVASKNKYLTTARIFLKELNRQGFIPADITQNIKSFPQIKKHKRSGLTEKEVQKITELLKELPDTSQNLRKKALFCLLTLQGLRQIEIARFDVEDIDFTSGTAYIQGKGQAEKELVHLAPPTTHALKKYLKTAIISSGAVFKSLGNRSSNRLTTRTIEREFKSLFVMLGINKTVHGFRHYFITTLLEKMEVRDVRKFSRHRSLEMLITYNDELDISRKSETVFSCFSHLEIS
jgi:integrase